MESEEQIDSTEEQEAPAEGGDDGGDAGGGDEGGGDAGGEEEGA